MSLNPFQSQQLQTAPPQKKIFETSYVPQPQLQSSPLQSNSPNRINQNQQYNLYQIRCHYHPQQCITNFCSNPECQLPLCPVCVEVHTKEHTTIKGSIAQIEHIDQVVDRHLKEIKELQREEMIARQELNSIEVQRQGIGEEMLTVSNVKRQQCHELVEQYFEKLNANIKYNFEGNTSEQIQEIDQIRLQLSEINKKAAREEKNLNNPDKRLAALIQENENSKTLQMHEALAEQRAKLYSFQQKLPTLSVNDGEFSNLNLVLNQLIQIENQGDYLKMLNIKGQQQPQMQQLQPIPRQQRIIWPNSSYQNYAPSKPPVIYQSSMPPQSNQYRQQPTQYARQPRLYQYPEPRTSFQYPY